MRLTRQAALALAVVFVFAFFIILYHGARITFISSLAFSVFVTFIILLFLYPPRRLANDPADYTLWLYALFQLVTMTAVCLYVFYKTLSDVRRPVTKQTSVGMTFPTF